MSKKILKTILIDLDGVLNKYIGNYDENFIPDIKEGAYNFIKELSSKYNLKLFTTRNKTLAQKWLIKNGLDEFISDVTNIKEPAYLYIDDRCLQFNGDFNCMLKQIAEFKVYWKNN